MEIHGQSKELITLALEEDIGVGDVTTNAIISENQTSKAQLIAKEPLVLAGMYYVIETFRQVDHEVVVKAEARDGQFCETGTVLATIEGPTHSVLLGERTALNILQNLSGIATISKQYADRLEGLKTKVLDSRKTSPGMRLMQKYAARIGGVSNHRMGLFSAVLIKDNHIAAAGSITKAVELCRAANPVMSIEVETETLDDVKEALACEADIIMLDNMTIEQMREAVDIVAGRAKTEASGNVTLENLREIAQTGVDYVSVGAITHSAPASDISLNFLEI